MSTWLVTGAHGFLGSNAGAFLEGKAETVGQVRTGSAATTFTASAALDLTDAASVSALIQSIRPAVIFHAAAMSSHETCEQDPAGAMLVNATATASLAKAASSCGALMVYVSTDAVFDGSRGSYAETDIANPFSVYGQSKLAGEDAVRAATDHHLILRTNFFGWSPSGTRSILEFFVNGFRSRSQMTGYTDFTVTSIYVQQLLSATAALVERGSTGTFHVASRDALSKFEFGRTVAKTFALDASLLHPGDSTAADHSTSRSRDLSLSTAKLESVLGYPSPSQAEGIATAYDDEAALTGRLRGKGAGA
jgi:dTDP-4-dehydrorhamnose reductase